MLFSFLKNNYSRYLKKVNGISEASFERRANRKRLKYLWRFVKLGRSCFWGCGVIGSTVVSTGQKKVKGKKLEVGGARIKDKG